MRGLKESIRRPEVVLALLITLLAVAVRLRGLAWGLPDVGEEATPMRKAWDLWGWGPGRGFDPNPHFFNYPSLSIYLQFLAQGLLYLLLTVSGRINSSLDFRVLYLTDPTAFLLIGRAVTVLFAAGTVALVFAIGRRLGGLVCAVPAALLLALNPIHMAQSVVVEVDVPLTFFTTWSLMYALRVPDQPTRTNHLMAGLAAGLAAATKYTGVFVLLPLVLAHFLARRRGSLGGMASGAPSKSGSGAGSHGPGATAQWSALIVAIAAALLAFALTSPFILLDARSFWHDLAFERVHMRVGHFGVEGSTPTLAYYAEAMGKRLLGWPSFVLAVAGVVLLGAFRRRDCALVLAALLIPVGAVVSSWSMTADRYMLPLVPPALLICGWMLAEGASFLERRRVGPTTRLVALLGAAAVLLIGPAGGLYVFAERLRPEPRTEAKRWIQAHVSPGALIATEALGPDLLDPLELAPLEPELRSRILKENPAGGLYAVQIIPMFTVKPERSAAFYDLDLYRAADYIVTTSQVGNRYRDAPDLFPRQLAFYDSLDARFDRAARFASPAPHERIVTIYRNPRQSVPFGRRRPVEGPVALRPAPGEESGEESFFYFSLGLNYETFGFLEAAVASYSQALQYSSWRPKVFGNVALEMTRCLLALGRGEEAARFVGAALSRAPHPEDRAVIEELRRRVPAGSSPDR